MEYPEWVCNDCGEVCDLVSERIDYAGTHCTHGKPGIHYTGHWVSDCCGADYHDYVSEEDGKTEGEIMPDNRQKSVD